MHVWWKQENDEVEKISWGHHEISQAKKQKTKQASFCTINKMEV
jgi:hypothetical protein